MLKVIPGKLFWNQGVLFCLRTKNGIRVVKHSFFPLVKLYLSGLSVLISLLLGTTKVSDICGQSLQVWRKGGLDMVPDASASISGFLENCLIGSVFSKPWRQPVPRNKETQERLGDIVSDVLGIFQDAVSRAASIVDLGETAIDR